MTTAARPTYAPARGGSGKGEGDLSVLSKQYSSRDLPSHTKLKSRQTGQDTTEELRSRDFRKELEDRERSAFKEKSKEKGSRSHGESSSKKSRLEMLTTSNLDMDDPVDDDDDDDSDDSDDEDDTAELLAELQKIKRERAEEQSRKEAEKKVEEERIRTENIIAGNPLLNGPADHKVKRRWDDDVVFKNCAKDDDKIKSKGFINDTIRSDFHKRFMEKYVK
ncbi:spliceosome-associated protein CWC15 homolog [Rhopilema esculentum]|uniref:spliceosome-associated protein CWC15 homolog n=1 Tax=Rhopilema esculentum TaxID=499914 RepID=UPI0031D0365D|eukprot:gene16696-8144_t